MNVDFNNEQPQKNSLELLETMRGIESIKKDNEKLVKAIKEKEELNEILLKNMTHNKQNKNIGKTSNNVKKEVSIYESHNNLIIKGNTWPLNKIAIMFLKKTPCKRKHKETRKKKWHTNQ